jgi:hypothetical protein
MATLRDDLAILAVIGAICAIPVIVLKVRSGALVACSVGFLLVLSLLGLGVVGLGVGGALGIAAFVAKRRLAAASSVDAHRASPPVGT